MPAMRDGAPMHKMQHTHQQQSIMQFHRDNMQLHRDFVHKLATVTASS